MVHPYSSIDTFAACKELRFISSVRSDFHTTGRLLIAVHAFASHELMSVSVDETLLQRQVKSEVSRKFTTSSTTTTNNNNNNNNNNKKKKKKKKTHKILWDFEKRTDDNPDQKTLPSDN